MTSIPEKRIVNPMKRLILFLAIFISIATPTFSQSNFELPKNITLKTKDDYSKYETDIINAAKWLEETDLNKEIDKRQEINAFVIQWLSGSPTVTVEVSEPLIKLYDKNVQLLALYLASYSRYSLENKTTVTRFLATKFAIISIMKVYQKGIEIKKSKEMEKLIKTHEDGKLDEYIQTKFKYT